MRRLSKPSRYQSECGPAPHPWPGVAVRRNRPRPCPAHDEIGPGNANLHKIIPGFSINIHQITKVDYLNLYFIIGG